MLIFFGVIILKCFLQIIDFFSEKTFYHHGVQLGGAYAHSASLFWHYAFRRLPRYSVDFQEVEFFFLFVVYKIETHYAATVEHFVQFLCGVLHQLRNTCIHFGGGYFVRKTVVFGFVVEKLAANGYYFGNGESYQLVLSLYHTATELATFR